MEYLKTTARLGLAVGLLILTTGRSVQAQNVDTSSAPSAITDQQLNEVVVTEEEQSTELPYVREIDQQDLSRVPVASLEEVTSLQPGVEPGLEIRGSDFSEALIRVDGASMRQGRTNESFSNMSITSIDEVQMQTGGFGAEHGNARSGVLDVRTRGSSTPSVVSVSDEEIRQVVATYIDLTRIRLRYRRQYDHLQQTATDEQIKDQMEKELQDVFRARGIQPQEYAKVLRAAKKNVKLREKVLKYLDELTGQSSGSSN